MNFLQFHGKISDMPEGIPQDKFKHPFPLCSLKIGFPAYGILFTQKKFTINESQWSPAGSTFGIPAIMIPYPAEDIRSEAMVQQEILLTK